MKKPLKIEDIDPAHRWAWAANINGMGSIEEQKIQLIKFVCDPIYIFDDANQVVLDAARNGSVEGPNGALIVVGIRALGRKWNDAFSLLGVSGDYIYSISTNYLYDCNSVPDFNQAKKEYDQQVLIPARDALKRSGKRSGPNRKLDKELLNIVQLKRNSGDSLPKIKADLWEQYKCDVSVPTLSRRTKPPVLKG